MDKETILALALIGAGVIFLIAVIIILIKYRFNGDVLPPKRINGIKYAYPVSVRHGVSTHPYRGCRSNSALGQIFYVCFEEDNRAYTKRGELREIKGKAKERFVLQVSENLFNKFSNDVYIEKVEDTSGRRRKKNPKYTLVTNYQKLTIRNNVIENVEPDDRLPIIRPVND